MLKRLGRVKAGLVLVLVITSGANYVEAALGIKLGRDAEWVQQTTGFEIGGVAPSALTKRNLSTGEPAAIWSISSPP